MVNLGDRRCKRARLEILEPLLDDDSLSLSSSSATDVSDLESDSSNNESSSSLVMETTDLLEEDTQAQPSSLQIDPASPSPSSALLSASPVSPDSSLAPGITSSPPPSSNAATSSSSSKLMDYLLTTYYPSGTPSTLPESPLIANPSPLPSRPRTSSASTGLSRTPPQAFVCPLTLEVMVDPVLDAQGNTYESQAILIWLDTNRISPISRQPLHPSMLVPNLTLRNLIHEYMGKEWVQEQQRKCQYSARASQQQQQHVRQQQQQHLDNNNNCTAATSSSTEEQVIARSRGKIDAFLANMSLTAPVAPSSSRTEPAATSPPPPTPRGCLKLNDQGCAAFRYDNVTVVLDVAGAAGAGLFSLYTRDLLPPSVPLTASVKDRLLELNFLQGETRGGVLSLKKHGPELGCKQEVIFSYNDRVTEVSATDFTNILFNFVETAIVLRNQLMALATVTTTTGGGGATMTTATNSTTTVVSTTQQQHQQRHQSTSQAAHSL